MRLLGYRRRNDWMTVAGRGNCMSAVEIKVPIPIACIYPNAKPAFSRDWHLLICRQLVFLFRGGDGGKRRLKCLHSSNPRIYKNTLRISSRQHEPGLFVESKHQIHVLNGLTCRAFYKVVEC